MKTELHPVRVVLFEGKGARPIEKETRTSVTATLLDQGYSVTRVSGDSAPLSATSENISVVVIGRFDGPAPEVSQGENTVTVREVGTLDAEAIVRVVDEARESLAAPVNQPGAVGAWKPWFPVIDYDRCTNCLQCLSFCLFDVYGVDDDKQIEVKNNDNCKTNCPACSRVCPEVAIMFPKYASGPINGEAVKQADVERESMKVDISSLLGGDIYSSLRVRSEKAKSRFSKERSPDKALDERKRCLTKLQQSGIIPAEVLAELDLSSLPSPEDIQRKAKELAALRGE